MYFDFERTARANKVNISDYRNGTNAGFWVKVWDKKEESKDFVANVDDDFQLQASGYVAEILNTVVIPDRNYFLSGVNVVADKVIEVPLYGEVSRWKPDGILHEKIVDVSYLAEMQENRKVYAEIWEDLENERYLVKAAIVNATEDAKSNLYKGCQHPDCRAAKVFPVHEEDGTWKYQCTKCGFKNPGFERRAMPKLDLVGIAEMNSGTAQKVTTAIFKSNAEALFEVMEKQMVKILEEQGPQHFADVFNQVYGIKAVLRLKANVFQDGISYSVTDIFFE